MILRLNNEITKYVISQLKEHDLAFNEIILQHLIFHVKMNLGKNHPLYDKIPYYWCDGPFNELIRDSFASSKKYLDITYGNYSLNDKYLNDFKNVEFIKKYPEFEVELNPILSKGNYIYSALVEDTYKKFQPLEILHTFKYKIYNPAQSAVFGENSAEYTQHFNRCLSFLKSVNYNPEYTEIFSKFTTHINHLNSENMIGDNWINLRNSIKNLWFCFAEGFRLKNHDIYYDGEYDEWMGIYRTSLYNLRNSVYKLCLLKDNTFDELFHNTLKDVKLVNKKEIVEFITNHASVIELIDEAMPIVRKYFPQYDYDLELILDPDGDEFNHLVFHVRSYDDDAFEKDWKTSSKMTEEFINLDTYEKNENGNLFSVYLGVKNDV